MPVRFTRARLSVAAAYRSVAVPPLGAVAIFAGRVRPDPSPGGGVWALLYEAHEPLAIAALERLEAQARRRFSVERVVIWHRLGVVSVGEASVVIAVGAGHRAPAFAACRFLIEQLKRTAPIWKTDQVRRARPRRPRRPLPGGRSRG